MATPTFDSDIRRLFRERDRTDMEFAFDLWSYDDVREYANDIYDRIDDGSMPCDGEWPAEQLALLRTWIDAGYPR